jgi:DNA polymerase (family 10)
VTVQVDLRTVPAESWGAALMYFTGSKEHNVKMREKALAQGLTLNEYGLFPDDDPDAGPPQERGIDPSRARTRRRSTPKLSSRGSPPEMREDRGELSIDDTPELIVEDIKAELHAHTTASDGKLSLDELARAYAIDRGFHTLAVTDHSKSSAQAGGLNEERLREQADAIAEANAGRQEA